MTARFNVRSSIFVSFLCLSLSLTASCSSDTDDTSTDTQTDGTDGTSATDATSGTDATDGTAGTDATDATSGTDGTDADDGTDATDSTDGTDATDGTTDECVAVATLSDFSSLSVSLLKADGSLCADNVLNSGSVAPGVVNALSSDTVPAGNQHPEGLLTLIDRTNSVLTWYDTTDREVTAQLSVSTGFFANPKDIAYDGTTAYVSRYEANGAAGAEDFDGGSDILVIDLTTNEITGRIDLSSEADSDKLPRPATLHLQDSTLWVLLEHINADYSAGGQGIIVGIDTDTLQVEDNIPLPYDNCTGMSVAPSGAGAWIVCTGHFTDPNGQVNSSGLTWFDFGDASTGHVAAALELTNAPLGFSVATIDEDNVVFTALGNFDPASDDAVHVYNKLEGTVSDALATGGAFSLGSLVINWDSKTLFVADGDAVSPGILRFQLDDAGSITTLDAVDPSPETGLPPRGIGLIR